ncbi:MAG TPA: hypothetical protein VMF03_05590 [Steroidobacteraceae bacterium]|nr:hypothetical protein [Steroidobacteraceae bacterium]
MSEVAIILSDLYLAANGRGGVDDRDAAVPRDALPALTRMARYAGVSPLPGDWRGWLAEWLGRADLAAACNTTPAVIAAAALPGMPQAGSLWLATPLHLVAGLTSVHLDYRGLLRLDPATLEELCREFDLQFAERQFALQRLPGAGLLVTGPRFATLPRTLDPARMLGGGIADGTVHGAGAAPLLMLGAELEMWLHAHPLNASRARRRQAPLTTLWLWGGGTPPARQLTAPPTAADSTFMTVFGEDAVAAGLCALSGARLRPCATSAHELLNSGAARTAAVIELFRTDRPQPATLMDLLAHLDEMLLAPVITALKDGVVRQVTLIANDRCSVLTARDGLRFWRRSRGPWAVLQ